MLAGDRGARRQTEPHRSLAGSPGRPSLARLDRSSALFVAVVIMTAAPMVAAALSLVGRQWHPASDLAIELLQIDDVGGRHTPLTGAHSRYGWDHPGPWLFWLLAPFEWLFGATGVLVGVAVLNTAATVGALVVARRLGGVTLSALVAVVLLVLIQANDTDLFVNPWNPWVAVLPWFTYVLLAWALADGDIGVLPWLIGVGTFVVQAHVGYAPLVAGAAIISGLLAWRSWRDPWRQPAPAGRRRVRGDRGGVVAPGDRPAAVVGRRQPRGDRRVLPPSARAARRMAVGLGDHGHRARSAGSVAGRR